MLSFYVSFKECLNHAIDLLKSAAHQLQQSDTLVDGLVNPLLNTLEITV